MSQPSIHVTTQFIAALPMPAAVIGPDQRIMAANEKFAQNIGMSLVGRHFITAFRQPMVIDAVESALQTGQTVETEFHNRINGADISFDVHISAVGAAVLVTLTDRTGAETMDRMRRDFIANVSHELRTPLTALMGFIETLRGAARNDADARDRFLAIMEQEAGRMTHLVDELMTLSKLEGIAHQQPDDKIMIGDVVSAVVAAMSTIAQSANVALDIDTSDMTQVVRGDYKQLQQVLTNLIENAIKYGGQDKTVTLTVSHVTHQQTLRADGIKISVSDQGSGIAPHHLARLTERFYRVDNHRSRQVGGTGLGLAIVKHIVNRHRGRMKISSTLGKGTTVDVYLPAK